MYIYSRLQMSNLGILPQPTMSSPPCNGCSALAAVLKNQQKQLMEHEQTMQEQEQKIQETQEQMETLCKTVDALVNNTVQLGNIRRRMCLTSARWRVTKTLKYPLRTNETWQEYFNRLSSAQKQVIGFSHDTYEILRTGALALNVTAHSPPLEEIAQAIVDVTEQKAEWLDLFRFAYRKEAWDVVAQMQA